MADWQTGGPMLLAKPALKWSLLAGNRQARPAVPSWWRGTSARSTPAGVASCFFEPRFSLSRYLTTMRRCSRIRRPRLSRCRYTFTPAPSSTADQSRTATTSGSPGCRATRLPRAGP
jgi:hypothetical protein